MGWGTSYRASPKDWKLKNRSVRARLDRYKMFEESAPIFLVQGLLHLLRQNKWSPGLSLARECINCVALIPRRKLDETRAFFIAITKQPIFSRERSSKLFGEGEKKIRQIWYLIRTFWPATQQQQQRWPNPRVKLEKMRMGWNERLNKTGEKFFCEKSFDWRLFFVVFVFSFKRPKKGCFFWTRNKF